MAKRIAKRTYPHVDAITDFPTKQPLRLLWDRVFELKDQVDAANLKIDVANQNIATLDQNIRDVYELAQSAEAGTQALEDMVNAPDEIVDDGLGAAGCSDNTGTGDVVGEPL